MVTLTDDLADLPLVTSRAIEVREFVPDEQIDPIFYDKAYYLVPDGAAGLKPYLLLCEALARVDRVAVVKAALLQRETLATIRVHGSVLMLNTMHWPDEVRDAAFDFLDKDVKLRMQEVRLASSLVDSMSGDFHPDDFTDSSRKAVQQVIDVKIGKEETVVQPRTEEPIAPTDDLTAALCESVERARAARGGAPAEEEKRAGHATVTPIKKDGEGGTRGRRDQGRW
jgi:DNA end-binding protein Ku